MLVSLDGFSFSQQLSRLDGDGELPGWLIIARYLIMVSRWVYRQIFAYPLRTALLPSVTEAPRQLAQCPNLRHR
jgi:hypothetical protein